MIHQHPLAYLIGLEGVALLRAFAGEHDEEFVAARLAEVRSLLDRADELGPGGSAAELTSAEAYASWAPAYDQPGNQLLDIEGPLVRSLLDELPAGVALDAACGTGRHAEYLARRGHTVIGVDSSPDMLAVARAKVPSGRFVEGELTSLPVPDDDVDLVVCALALSHVPDLKPVFAEFARVLRPGGSLVVSDPRGRLGDIGLPIVVTGPDGRPGYLPNRSRLASEYLAAALPLGFEVRHCEEPMRPSPFVGPDGAPPGAPGAVPPPAPSGTPPNIWSLHPLIPDAANAAYEGSPVAIVWRFQLTS
ncbi:class I SAM-dependent DNA methyltransferase [Jiangella rhizosphaerae]|uniref:Class I SAM-dependent methyltransferase n=1 Tax=Jiangella rhizosphaerae TaxID=2293569 RepID=A0A418KHI6_9ACTN|nr:class I SAM-dependent methyltransferase [Jiangella rhizosphaerae]RIQ11365.1 class I SAM-dependent methyltransferase [Jiangella rhizosphaerae]